MSLAARHLPKKNRPGKRPNGSSPTTPLGFEAGGIPLLLKTLLDHGYLHGEVMTVTGRSLKENLAKVKWNPDQDVVRPANDPISPTGGVVGLIWPAGWRLPLERRGWALAVGLLVGVGLLNAYHRGIVAGTDRESSRPAAPPAGSRGGDAVAAQAALTAEIFRLKQRLREEPSDLQALTRLAHIHHDRQLWEPAALYYEQAVGLSPDDPNLLTDLGICYRGLRRFDDALGVFARARAADGTHWESPYNSAVVLAFDLGQYDRAREALQPLLAMDSPPPQVAELLDGIERAHSAAQGTIGKGP